MAQWQQLSSPTIICGLVSIPGKSWFHKFKLVVSSCSCPERFHPGSPVFLPSQKMTPLIGPGK